MTHCPRCGKQNVDPIYPHTCTPLALTLADELEAIEGGWHIADACCAELRRLHAENDALRAALAEHYCDTHCTWLDHAAGCDRAEQPAEQEPVGLLADRFACSEGLCPNKTACGAAQACLYAAPQPAKQPLTQQEVVDGFCKTPHQVQYIAVFDAGVRFAERAHGIGGGV